MTFSYTFGMKTAISIPDKIFKEADEFAKAHNFSRSKLFTEAIVRFLTEQKSKALLRTLNKVHSEPDPSETEAQEQLERYSTTHILKEEY